MESESQRPWQDLKEPTTAPFDPQPRLLHVMLRLLLFVFLTAGCSGGLRPSESLVSVRIDSGEWLVAREIQRGHLYWFYPRPEIDASWCRSCAEPNTLNIGIRFWNEDLFDSLRLGLRKQGRCGMKDPCHIAPYQTTRVVLRDPKRNFKGLPLDFAAQGILPAFRLYSVGWASNTSSNETVRPIPWKSLKYLEVDIIKGRDIVTVGVTIMSAKETPAVQDVAASENTTTLSLIIKQIRELAVFARAEHILDPALLNLRLQPIEDCFDVKRQGLSGGLFYLRPLRRAVRCTADGYLVILHREGDGVTDFNVTHRNYEKGIGQVEAGDYFLGLEALSTLTMNEDFCMELQLHPWRLNVSMRRAMYDSFMVSSSEDHYRLSYTAFQGTTLFDVLSFGRGKPFSTFDRDRDDFVGNCAIRYKSGNWFASCMRSNVFGHYVPNAFNGMCSGGMAASQGTMCSPLSRVQMLLRKKSHAPELAKIVYSAIAYGNCNSTLELFSVTESGLYTITVGGAPGGLSQKANTRPGGQGAKVTGTFKLEKGSTLALSAGCRGKSQKGYAGHGGCASWVVLRPKGVLLIVGGGGGGANEL